MIKGVISQSQSLHRNRNKQIYVRVASKAELHNLGVRALVENIHIEIKWNANLMQLGNFSDVFLAWNVSGTYAHHQEH